MKFIYKGFLFTIIVFLLTGCFFNDKKTPSLISNDNSGIVNSGKIEVLKDSIENTGNITDIKNNSWSGSIIEEKNKKIIKNEKKQIEDKIIQVSTGTEENTQDNKPYYKVTNLSGGDSVISISNLDGVDFNSNLIEINGMALGNVDKIDVVFENKSSKFPIDNYTLKKYKQGSYNFKYVAGNKYKNLDIGLNEYTFIAYAGGKQYKTKIEILKTIIENNKKVALDNLCFYGNYCFDKDREVFFDEKGEYNKYIGLDEDFKYKDEKFYIQDYGEDEYKNKYVKAMIPGKTFYYNLEGECNEGQVIFTGEYYILVSPPCGMGNNLYYILNKDINDFKIPSLITYGNGDNTIKISRLGVDRNNINDINYGFSGDIIKPGKGDILTDIINYKKDIEKYLLLNGIKENISISFKGYEGLAFNYEIKLGRNKNLYPYYDEKYFGIYTKTTYDLSYHEDFVNSFLYINDKIDEKKLKKIEGEDAYYVNDINITKDLIDKYLQNKFIKKDKNIEKTDTKIYESGCYYKTSEKPRYTFLKSYEIKESDLPIFQVNYIENGNMVLSFTDKYCIPERTGLGKPAIYIYDKFNRDNSVLVDNKGDITYLKPDYNIHSGWKFSTKDGQVIVNGINYDYLRYELSLDNYKFNDKGWVLNGKNIKEFLSEKLDLMNFNEKEKKAFLDYWVNKFDNKNTYFISFKFNDEINKYAGLKFGINPNNLFRVVMEAKKINNSSLYDNSGIELKKIDRNGDLVVVEWGGVIRN